MSSSCCAIPIARRDYPARPFTLSQQAQKRSMIRRRDGDGLRHCRQRGTACAEGDRRDVVQLDEPWVRTSPEKATRYGLRAITVRWKASRPDRVHLCFGYAAVCRAIPSERLQFPAALAIRWRSRFPSRRPNRSWTWRAPRPGGQADHAGVLDLGDPAVETAAIVADRIRAGLRYVAPEHLIPAPDCGMKYLPRTRRSANCGHWRRAPRSYGGTGG